MKKRIFALMLAVMTVFMTACGGGAAYVPGTFTETGYESEFLGFRFTTPEGYVLASSEELSEMMGITLDVMNETGNINEKQEQMIELTTIYELMATDAMGVNNVNVVLEKNALPINSYVKLLKEQIQNMQGITFTINNEEEVEFLGETYIKLSMNAEASGIVMNQEYYVRKVEGYIMAVTVSWFDGYEAEKEAIMNAFAAY